MNTPDLPDLRILPMAQLVLHEDSDPHRNGGLTEQLRAQGVLRNPPIIAPMPDSDRFVVLDGANRTTSLRQMGFPHILAQVVNYDEVQLTAWNHLVTEVPTEVLLHWIAEEPGLREERATLDQARVLLTARRCLAYLVLPDGCVVVLRGGEGLVDEARLLNHVVASYRGRGRIVRLKGDSMDDALTHGTEVAALVVFPRFTPADIVSLAMMDHKLPTGITRHIIPMRALRVDYDLARLADTTRSLAQKQADLRQILHDRLNRRRIRAYHESTVLYDE